MCADNTEALNCTFNDCKNCSFSNKHPYSIRIATWNVNSWTDFNSTIRKDLLKILNPDIIYVIETKLKNNEVIDFNGYVWYGFNRKGQLRTARCGSGGVGIFLKNELLSEWSVEIVDKSLDGLFIV